MPQKISRKRNLTPSQSNPIFKVKKVGDKMTKDDRKRHRIDINKAKYQGKKIMEELRERNDLYNISDSHQDTKETIIRKSVMDRIQKDIADVDTAIDGIENL